MEQQQPTRNAPGRCVADSHAARHGVRKQAWFYYTLARLAVARNLAVALAIAVMCVGVAGLTLWTVGSKQRPHAAATPGRPTQQQLTPALSVDPSSHPERTASAAAAASPGRRGTLYYTVRCLYQCGHQCSFIPAERGLGAKDIASYTVKMGQLLCPACQAIADRRARQAALDKAAPGGQANGSH